MTVFYSVFASCAHEYGASFKLLHGPMDQSTSSHSTANKRVCVFCQYKLFGRSAAKCIESKDGPRTCSRGRTTGTQRSHDFRSAAKALDIVIGSLQKRVRGSSSIADRVRPGTVQLICHEK